MSLSRWMEQHAVHVHDQEAAVERVGGRDARSRRFVSAADGRAAGEEEQDRERAAEASRPATAAGRH